MKSLFAVTLIFGFLTLGFCQNVLYCWVGYANNGNLRGGPIPCDGGTCVHVNGTYSNQQLDLFACEPMGLCSSTGHISVAGLDGYCCTSGDNCNANGFTMPVQTTPTPGLPTPIICNEGIYMNNVALTNTTIVKKVCYGNCASVTGSLGANNFTVATCDPLTLCDNLDLVNSCHVMPQKVISGCCCNSNLCIDPANNVQPTPPMPPPGSIKCFIGLQQDNQTPIGSETYCPGMCHSTSAMIGTSNYTVYACDRYQVCEMFGIRPNQCGSEEGALQSCCCDSDNCNTPGGFTPPTVDPNPPIQAEHCFTGFQTSNLGPLGRSMECLGDCVTYSAGGLKIFGCDPISVCEQLGAKNGTGKFGALNVTCCSTRDCNYQAVTTTTSCYNGITINMPSHNVTYSKAQSLPCKGRCATFSVAYQHLNVDVYTCDPYNVCNLNSSDILKVNCCDSPNCNLNNNTIPVTTVAPMGRNISCFQGFQIGFGFPFGNQMTCDGACARVHIGRDTIYTCDPGDTCGDFGVDGCNMLFDGLTVCCCKGQMCNAPEAQIRPAIKQNLNCFIGYGVGAAVSGGQLPCNGMCGKLSTMINNVTTIDAYLCLDLPICTERDAYERCGHVMTDRAVKVCCCGGYDHCNYEPMNSTVLPPPAGDNKVTCPQGLYVNGRNLYNTGNTVVTCPNSCGLMQFNTTYNQNVVNFAYYGCDPAAFCSKFSTVNSCGALGNSISGCCCDSDMCMNPLVGRMTPSQTNPNTTLSCWVGYNYNNSLQGGSVPCDTGTCVHVNGTYYNQTVEVFACEPFGVCTDGNHLSLPGLDGWCCQDSDNCNAAEYTIPPPPSPAPSLPPPIICSEGLFINNKPISQTAKKLCYGNCASVSLAISNTTTFTVATCDPLTLCDNLDLVNSCHVMPQKVISGCCCNSNLCIDPANNVQPTPPMPPPGSIKCFIGLQQDNQTPIGSETYCPGMCHSTSAMIGTSNYTVYACDRYQVCEMFGIRPNQCGSEEGALQSCCCDSDNCNTPGGFTPPTVDPNPPIQAERCFTGFQTSNLGPLGRSMECLGDCVTYSAGGLKIFGCDPISVCEQLGAKNGTGKFGALNVTCCSTRDCNYQAVTTTTSCYNGITINMPSHNVTYSKAQSLPCKGRCATFSVAYQHLNVDVYTCDPYNVCNLNSSDILKVNCCDSPNCNLNNNTIPVTTVAPMGRNISCFQGFQIGFGFPFGNQMTCDGACARVHIGRDTIYTCDPGDTCGDFGVDGCNMLFDGLTVCCCKGQMCNAPEAQIRPAIKQNLNCFIGYGVGAAVSGGQLPCNGMCGKLSTMINNVTTIDAYLCLDLPICTERDAYERCGHVMTDRAVKVCCCGGYDHCNYEPMNSTVLPPPAGDNKVTCPQGLYVNGRNLYNTGNTVVTCPNSCGLMQFNTTYNQNVVNFAYYGCDPAAFCSKFSTVNSCGALGNSISGCCCDSDMCMNPLVGRMTPSQTNPNTTLSCWVGYNYNNSLQGGSVPCDTGTCVHVNGTYYNQTVDVFACEPFGVCTDGNHLSLPGLDGWCCQDSDNCNAAEYTIPPPPSPAPSLPPPIICSEGLFINNKPISQTAKKLCYGNCASVSLAISNTTTFTVATCDPLTLCDNLDLVNSCHVMPQKVISGCCCNSNLCIDPANNVQPTPPMPPPGSIKCFIGLQQDNQTPIGSETYCPGMCHSTSAMIGTSNYTVYACDRYQVCEMFGIRPNQCGSEEGALQSCCCDSDNCNTPGGFTPPTVDPNPPIQAERCFTGFQTSNLGPLGRSMECLGDCVTYSAGGLKIFGCDPISVCEQLGAKNGTGKFGALNVTCCSTRDCNYQAVTTTTSCYNGITINMPSHNVTYSKAQSLPCKGRCATFSVAYQHLNVDVYTCDPYNVCNLNSSDILKVNCCDSPNCNLNNNTIPVTTVAPMGRNISCFQGFQIGFGFPFGNQMTCDGACARVHIGRDTIYTCDPGDTCGDFGVDGCNMLFDGLTVCCCKNQMCNAPEALIRPAIKENLNCFVGYSFGDFVSGGQLPCNGMCGKLTTSINSTVVNAYLCLDLPICTERNAYERCGHVQTDMAVKVCCCGGYDHCNYEPMNSTVLPPPAVDNNVTCPQGLYVNGKNLYNTGNTVVTCPNSCGLMQFNTTFMNQTISFGYYGCDPKTLCDDFNADNSCGAMNSISGCCCNSDMCMNPLVGRMIPGSGPSPTQGTGATTTASATSNTLSAILLLTLSLLFL